jgi:glucose-6-phosphate isomerase
MQQEFFNFKTSSKICEKLIARKGYKSITRDTFGFVQDEEDIKTIKEIANFIINEFEDIIFIATGASILIPKIFYYLDKNQKNKCHFLCNIDPISIKNLLQEINPKKTAIISISKSGNTLETILLTKIMIDHIESFTSRERLSCSFYAICEDGDNILRKTALTYNAKIINHPSKVSGRFSIFSPVAILPLAIWGFDIEAYYAMTKDIIGKINIDEVYKTSSFAIQNMNDGCNNMVYMTYSDQLIGFNDWYRQIIAESLGKNSVGINPIMASGTIDQHSQLQLYLDGPDDKFYNVISANCKYDFKVKCDDVSNKYISLNDVMQNYACSVRESLILAKRKVRVINLPKINEKIMLEMMCNILFETVSIADYFDINPFNQPAVEYCKQVVIKNIT